MVAVHKSIKGRKRLRIIEEIMKTGQIYEGHAHRDHRTKKESKIPRKIRGNKKEKLLKIKEEEQKKTLKRIK